MHVAKIPVYVTLRQADNAGAFPLNKSFDGGSPLFVAPLQKARFSPQAEISRLLRYTPVVSTAT